MDEIKRKISEEFDTSGDAELSSDLRHEIETSGELKDYADDLIKVEGVLHALRDAKTVEPEWDSLHDEISRSMDVDGEVDASLLEAPMPDGEKDDALPAKEPVEEKKPPKKDAEPEDEGPRQRLTAAKTTAKGESSGVINLGALVEQHRKSMAPTGGGLDVPSGVIRAGAPQQKGSKMLPIAIAAGVLVVVGIAGAIMYSKAKSGQNNAVDIEALRAQLKEELKDEYKTQILAELKAKGMSTEEAEAEAERQAEQKAAHEAEKKATEAAEAAAEGDQAAEALLAASSDQKKKKKKKKSGSGGEASPTATNTYSSPKTAPKKETTKKAPTSAGDDLAALLEGATGSKKKGSSGELEKPAKTPTKTEPKSSALDPKPTTNPNLPKTLAKADIRKTMNKIKPRILKCGEGKLGTLMLALVVSSDGKVKSAKVSGKFATDPAGQCAENVAKTVTFPPFQNPTASVTYPFVFAPTPGQ